MKLFLAFLAASSLSAQPQVMSGSVEMLFADGRWEITAATERSVLHWEEFSIPAGHSKHFHLPDETSALLNRVIGNLPSEIHGALHSNGAVYLVNPNGVIFSQSAIVNVGSLVATTFDFSDADFMAGGELLFGGESLANIENHGKILAKEGDVVLFAHQIYNEGSIEAENVLIGAGHEILLHDAEKKYFYFKVPGEALINRGSIEAKNLVLQAGGQLGLSAWKNTGTIKVVHEEGKIFIRCSGGYLENQGKIVGGEVTIEQAPTVYNHASIEAERLDLLVEETYNFGSIAATSANFNVDSYIETENATLSGEDLSIRAHNYYTSGTTIAEKISIEADRLVVAAGKLVGAITLTSYSTEHPIQITPHARLHGPVEVHTLQMPNACQGNFPHSLALTRHLEEGPIAEGLEALGACIGTPLEFVDPNGADFPSTTFGATRVALSTGNIVITKTGDSSIATSAGAVYLYNGSNAALISTITGSSSTDQVGSSGVTALTNGNFVVRSPNWDIPGGGLTNVGAVTWGNGVTGFIIQGVVSENNSLIGSSTSDSLSNTGVTALTNGNYVVRSASWSVPGGATDVGAATWGNGSTGITGTVSVLNSLIGSTTNDQVSSIGVTALENNNYVVASSLWNIPGGAADVGAATWGNGTTGVTGTVSALNSLIGSTATSAVSNAGVTALTNGNYVIASSIWDIPGGAGSVGAATWGNGSTGITGTVSAVNSLIGSIANSTVSSSDVTALTNGNYVVGSSAWDIPGGAANVGAATWGNGTTGVTGTVSAVNSLIGSTVSDGIGESVTALTNGNYVTSSSDWNIPGGATDVGAATWGNGTTGVTGTVSVLNSLTGNLTGNLVGGQGVAALTNGNYVVASAAWELSAGTVNIGAVTWGNGSTGITGTVSALNSLIGSTTGNNVGNFTPVALTNGNYVVRSSSWSIPGGAGSVGAATWGNGTIGITGTVSVLNSLIGSSSSDNVSSTGIIALANGNYVVQASSWDVPGSVNTAGAATWGNGLTGITGTVSALNSLIGSTASDQVSNGIVALTNGNFALASSLWNNPEGLLTDAGAVTLGDGTTGTYCDAYGTITSVNSFLGPNGSAGLSTTITVDSVNQTFLVRFTNYDSQTRVFAFSQGITPTPTPSVETPPRSGRIDYNIALSEMFQVWTPTYLRWPVEDDDAPPLWTHKQLWLPLKSLISPAKASEN